MHFKGQKGQDALQAISNIFELNKCDEMLNHIENDSKLGEFIAKNLPEKHRLAKLINFEKVKDNLKKKYESSLTFYHKFLGKSDKQKVFDLKLPKSDYNIAAYRKRMSKLYPLINHVGGYRWSLDKDMAKALVDYIKIVDEHTERNNIFLQAENKKDA